MVQSTVYRDLDGDHDMFPDTGETGRLVITGQNRGPALTGVVAILSSSDPNVAFFTESSVPVGNLAQGQVVTIGSLDPGQAGFVFTVSNALQSLSGTDPVRIQLCLRLTANEISGQSSPDCFRLAADLDLPAGASETFIPGPDGIASSADDGTVAENFDIDKNGDGNFTLKDTFLEATAPGTYRGTCSNAPETACQTAADCPAPGPGEPAPLCYTGTYLRGSDTGVGPDTVAGVACGGYLVPPQNPGCILDPDYPMDWHFHCPPRAKHCPNLESGTCVGNCFFDTNDGARAISPPNSLHMGAHFDIPRPLPPPGSESPDTTHLRSIQGFTSAPVNLSPLPRPGDLELSFFQMARLVDNTVVSGGQFNFDQCDDCAKVQIQVDTDPDPDVDRWGFWDNLVPFQNVYDHMPLAYSAIGTNTYCVFTPTDTGTAPPNPRGFHETLCYPVGYWQGAWSSCGDPWGTNLASSFYNKCDGPGFLDPSGTGVWVESRLHLDDYIGQRIRIRWIAETWVFDGVSGMYADAGSAWNNSNRGDEGWWVDDIKMTGAITRQTPPVPDTRPLPPCPDADGDGYGATSPPCPTGSLLDCDDADADTHPGAPEVNDGLDNQCPGDPGYGEIDEIAAVMYQADALQLCWQGQSGATLYQIARSDRRDFSGGCSVLTSASPCLSEPETPPVGDVFYYLVRPISPHVGSWGRDSSGNERTGICGL